jgi:hypothetical protein
MPAKRGRGLTLFSSLPALAPIEINTETKHMDITTETIKETIAAAPMLLPGGYIDDNGQCHKEIEINEITGRDEEAIANPNLQGNGGKIITALLSGTVTKIGSVKPTEDIIRRLLIGDRDFLMIKLRQVSLGSNYIKGTKCPACGSKYEVKINLNDIEMKECGNERKFPFTLSKGYTDDKGVTHKEGFMRLPTGVEQEYLSSDKARNGGTATTSLLTACCVSLGTVKGVTSNIIRSLSLRDRQIMGKVLNDNMPGPILESDNTCPSCHHEWKEALLVSDFFQQR